MNELTLHRPQTKEELIGILRGLAQQKERFVLYAGGTDVSPGLKLQRNPPQHIVFLSALRVKEMKQINQDSGCLHLGALCTLEEVANHSLVLDKLMSVASTAKKIASLQIRNKATLGGNILVDNRCLYYNQSKFNQDVHGACFKASGNVCQLVPSTRPGDKTLCRARFVSDLVPVLMLFNTILHVYGPKGSRMLLMRDFYSPDGISRNILEDHEFLTHIEIPLNPHAQITYHKLRIREAIDFPSVGVAVGIFEDEVKICISGVDTHPHFWSHNRKDFSSLELLAEKAIAMASKSITILKQDFFPASYRKKMIGVYIKRGLGLSISS